MKDTIYIDIEDDITGIIGKVKAAKEKVVALVPPKRIGALQSAVNLKLLQRAADHASKHVVLITNDHSLIALAAGLRIPVAKNLQSKPEIPQLQGPDVAAEEVIEGKELSVGNISLANPPAGGEALPPTAKQTEVMDVADAAIASAAPKTKPSGILDRVKDKKKHIPNFQQFRLRLFLIGGGGLALVLFLVWAIAIAPHAVVTITAKTTSVNVDKILSLDPALPQSDVNAGKLKLTIKQVKKTASATFTPTGSKTIGDAATGSITVRNCDYPSGFTLASGTQFTGTDNHVFVSTQNASVPAFTGPASGCTLGGSNSGKVTVAVKASAIGADYNVAAQAYAIKGVSGDVDAQGTAMAGGSSQTVTVVSQEDVDKAAAGLAKADEVAAKKELTAQFGNDQVIISESFSNTAGNPAPSPAVGEQSPQGKLTQDTTFVLASVARSDIKTLLHQQVDPIVAQGKDQQLFDLGDGHLVFQSFAQIQGGTYTTRVTTSASIGPKIDTKQLAKDIEGKRSGEVQQLITQIRGVQNVTVQYSPFWVSTAPGPDKTEIKFTVNNGS